MADFFVTNTNDSGAGSLRQALADAEEVNNAGHDQIIFDAAISGQTIRLTSGALDITSGSVSINGDIDGNGTIDITISGDATGDGRTSDDSALLNVSSGATAILDSLSLADGYVRAADESLGNVGASVHVISNLGTLTIANSVLASNYARGGRGGDGVTSGQSGGYGGNASIIATGIGSTTFITDTFLTGNEAVGGDGGYGYGSGPFGFDGGRGGDAALIVSSGNLELRNSISYFNTLDAGHGGRGGDGGFDEGGFAGSGGDGGNQAHILNGGVLYGVFGATQDTLGNNNVGGGAGAGNFANGGANGLSIIGHLDFNGGTSPDFGFFSQDLTYGSLLDQNFLNAVGDPLWLMGGNDFVSLVGGSPDADIIAGGAGIDNLFGGGGDDVVEGGLGNDVMSGGSNGAAGDTLTFAGFASRDGVYGVTFSLQDGNSYQMQFTGAGYDMAFGFENLTGSRYTDRLGEGLGINIIRGGLGNDTIAQLAHLADSVGETFDGGNGTDRLYLGGGYGGTVVNNLRGDNLLSFERLDISDSGSGNARHVLLSASQFGGNGIASNASVEFNNFDDNDEVIDIDMGNVNSLNLSQLVISGDLTDVNFLVTGDSNGETITGTTIRDVINGNGGADKLRGGGGNDALDGGAGIDNLLGGNGNDNLNGGDDDDFLDGQGNNDTLHGDAGLDELRGASGNDKLFGGAHDDVLIGGSGVDLLDGGIGNDTISNGASDGARDTIAFKDGYDLDRVNGFDQVGTDRLQLNDNLWLGTHGVLTAAQVVSTFGTINSSGTLITLNFGDGDILQVQNASGLNITTLSSDILIV